MEKVTERDNFQNIFNTLEDLYVLGDANLFPLFERLNFYLNEIKADRNYSNAMEEYSLVENLFTQKLKEELLDFFRKGEAGSKVDIVNRFDGASLKEINKVLSIFPMAKEIVSLFELKKNITITLENGTLTFQGELPLEYQFENLRDRTYLLTRKLFQHQVLLTFDIFESTREGSFNIRFSFDYDISNEKFEWQVDEKKSLLMPIIFKKFRKHFSMIKKVGDHPIYELDTQFNLNQIKADDMPDNLGQESVLTLHFPFLFRPISLIMKGHGESKASDHFKFEVDLFSLLQK